MTGNTFLEIDVSDVRDKVNLLTAELDPETFHTVMYRTVRDAATHAKKAVAEHVVKDYRVGVRAVTGSMGRPQITSAGAEVACLIPVRKTRGTIWSGATDATASYEALIRGPRAKILKEGNSLLPHRKGVGRVHFYIKSGSLEGHIMVRHEDGKRWTGKRRKGGKETGSITHVGSISHGVGIAIPQMPVNRSAKEIQEDVADYMIKRLEHHIKNALSSV